MNEHPKIEIHTVPTLRVRDRGGRLHENKYVTPRHAINKYMWAWRWYTYRESGVHPTEKELANERARILDSVGDALTDAPRGDAIVVS